MTGWLKVVIADLLLMLIAISLPTTCVSKKPKDTYRKNGQQLDQVMVTKHRKYHPTTELVCVCRCSTAPAGGRLGGNLDQFNPKSWLCNVTQDEEEAIPECTETPDGNCDNYYNAVNMPNKCRCQNGQDCCESSTASDQESSESTTPLAYRSTMSPNTNSINSTRNRETTTSKEATPSARPSATRPTPSTNHSPLTSVIGTSHEKLLSSPVTGGNNGSPSSGALNNTQHVIIEISIGSVILALLIALVFWFVHRRRSRPRPSNQRKNIGIYTVPEMLVHDSGQANVNNPNYGDIIDGNTAVIVDRHNSSGSTTKGHPQSRSDTYTTFDPAHPIVSYGKSGGEHMAPGINNGKQTTIFMISSNANDSAGYVDVDAVGTPDVSVPILDDRNVISGSTTKGHSQPRSNVDAYTTFDPAHPIVSFSKSGGEHVDLNAPGINNEKQTTIFMISPNANDSAGYVDVDAVDTPEVSVPMSDDRNIAGTVDTRNLSEHMTDDHDVAGAVNTRNVSEYMTDDRDVAASTDTRNVATEINGEYGHLKLNSKMANRPESGHYNFLRRQESPTTVNCDSNKLYGTLI